MAKRASASMHALLDEAEKAQRKGHLVLAAACRDASDVIGLLQHELVATRRSLAEQLDAARAEAARLRVVEIVARNVAVNANRGNDGVSAVPGCIIDNLRAALATKELGHE